MEPVARAVLYTNHQSYDNQEPPIFVNITQNVPFSWADLPAIELVKDQ